MPNLRVGAEQEGSGVEAMRRYLILIEKTSTGYSAYSIQGTYVT